MLITTNELCKKYADKLDWSAISYGRNLDEKFIEEMEHYINWDNFNPEHFEINIRCGDKVTKFKKKKKYIVSKVITKFIEYEKPEKIEGKLLREGIPLNATDIIEALDILDNEILDLK